MNHLFKANILDMDLIVQVYGNRIAGKQASIMSFYFPLKETSRRLSHRKIETNTQQGGTISSHRNTFLLPENFRAKSNINVI